MKVAIVGAGGIGGYFGGVLAKRGHEVHLLARGANLEAVKSRGMEIRTPEGSYVAPVFAVATADELGDPELAILAVKSYSLPEVTPALRRLAKQGTTILPLMNGIGINDRLTESGVGPESQLGGLTFVGATRTAPGVVERFTPFQRIVLGELDHTMSRRAETIVEVLLGAGVDAKASDRIEVEQWQKFIFISALAAVCGLTRSSIGPVRSALLGPSLIERAVEEAARVARASGVSLPAGEEARVQKLIHELPPVAKPSFLLDLLKGGPTEVDMLSGAVSRLGTKFGVPTPIHDACTVAAATSVAAAQANV